MTTTDAAARRLLRDVIWSLRKPLLPGLLAGVGWQLAALGLPLVLGWTVQRGVVDGDRSAIWLGAAAVLALGALEAVLAAVRHRVAVTMYAEATAQTRERLVRSVLDGADATAGQGAETLATGEVMGRAISDVDMVAEFADSICHTVAYLVAVPIILVSLFVIDPWIGMTVAVTMLLLALSMWRYSRVWVATGEQVQQAYAAATAAAKELVEGFKVVRGLGADQVMIDRYERESAVLRRRATTLGWYWLRYEPILDVLAVVAVAAVIVFGGGRVIDGEMDLGNLVAAAGLVLFVADPVRTLGQRAVLFQLALVSARRLAAVIVTGPRSDRSGGDAPPAPTVGSLPVSARSLTVEFGDVRPLEAVDAELAPGSLVHLTGAVGSGKTVLLRVLAGEVEPTSGEVTIGERPLAEWASRELHRAVLLCGPEPFLFGGTLTENIGFARAGADHGAIAAAAAAADVAEFASRLHDGLATTVGERGVTLSGGQRQRIGLARAVLARPRLLLLDGATTALDPERELRVVGQVKRALPDSTIVVVSPNPGMPAIADATIHLMGAAVGAELEVRP